MDTIQVTARACTRVVPACASKSFMSCCTRTQPFVTMEGLGSVPSKLKSHCSTAKNMVAGQLTCHRHLYSLKHAPHGHQDFLEKVVMAALGTKHFLGNNGKFPVANGL